MTNGRSCPGAMIWSTDPTRIARLMSWMASNSSATCFSFSALTAWVTWAS